MTFVQRRAAPPRRDITAAIALLLYSTSPLLHCSAFVSPAGAATPNATSERTARDEAVRAIPWRQMTPEHRRAAQSVIKHTSIYRRLPTRIIDCDPDMFTFLVQHPEVVIDVWRVMGISQISLEKIPGGMPSALRGHGTAAGAMPSAQRGHAVNRNSTQVPIAGSAYRAADGAGTTGTVRFLHADWGQNAQNLAVLYADGAYEGQPFVTPLKAQSILLLRSGAVRETNGRHYVTVRIDSFLRIEQMGLELIAKTVQPWINKTADQNFIETLTFVSNFSRTAEQNPHGIERLATRLPTIDAPTRNELVALSFRTAERYAANGKGPPQPAYLAHRSDAAIADHTWIGPSHDGADVR